MMHSPDLDVLKDIPGYKAILKAVLRSQIQLLQKVYTGLHRSLSKQWYIPALESEQTVVYTVQPPYNSHPWDSKKVAVVGSDRYGEVEQLADHTGEESVLLTANVSDGSLMHLGSESGKVFLEDHDEIKSQFLGFCLKRHHKRKAPEPPAPPVRRMVSDYPIQPEPRRSSMPTASPSIQKRPRMSESFSAAQTSTPIHPVSVSRSAGRPQRTSQSLASIRNQSPSHTQSVADLAQDADGAAVKEEESESSETQGTATETSKTLASEQTSGDDSSEHTIIKLEPMTESELDLEITGVEMGESSQTGFGQGDWSQNVPYSQSGGGGQAEVEGYDSGSQSEFGNNYTEQLRCQSGIQVYGHECEMCGKRFYQKTDLTRHIRIHTGEKPYQCDICQKFFSRKGNMQSHRNLHFVRQ